MAWEVGATEYTSTPLRTTVYVSPTGNDSNSGATSSAPFRTLAFAFSRVIGGGQVYLMTGTFTDVDAKWHTLPAGSSSAPTKVDVLSGTVTITPSAATPTNVVANFYGSTCQYIQVTGVVFDANHLQDDCVRVKDQTGTGSAHHITFINCTFKNANVDGFSTSNTGSNTLTNCTITANTFRGVVLSSSNNIIDGATIHTNGSLADHSGILLDLSTGTITGNVIKNCLIYNHTFGSGVMVSTGASGTLVYNNVVRANVAGISLVGGSTTSGIYHNTLYANTSYGVYIASSTATIRNNILYSNGGTEPVHDGGSSTYTADHNLFGTDPSFLDASSGDLHLTSSSNIAIDKGMDLTSIVPTDKDGNGRVAAPDLGAYEFQGTPSNFAVTTPLMTAGSVVRVPQVRNAIAPPTRATTATVYTPTVAGVTAQTVRFQTSGSRVTNVSVLRAPRVSNSIALPTRASTAVVYPPSSIFQITPPSITNTNTLYVPTVKYIVAMPTLSGSTLYIPFVWFDVVGPNQQLVMPTIFQVNALRTPTITPPPAPAAPPTIAAGSTVTTPTVTTLNTLSLSSELVNVADVRVPTVTQPPAAGSLITPALTNTNTLNAPTIASMTMSLPTLTSGAVLYPPSCESLSPPYLSSEAVVYAPSTLYPITLPTVGSGSSVGIPVIAGGGENVGGVPYITVFMWKRIS